MVDPQAATEQRLVYSPDFSTEAVQTALNEEALDAALPLPQRMTRSVEVRRPDASRRNRDCEGLCAINRTHSTT